MGLVYADLGITNYEDITLAKKTIYLRVKFVVSTYQYW